MEFTFIQETHGRWSRFHASFNRNNHSIIKICFKRVCYCMHLIYMQINVLLFKYLSYLFIVVEVSCMCHCVSEEVGEQRVKVSSFPPLRGPRDSTQIVRLGAKCLYLLCHLPSPSLPFKKSRQYLPSLRGR